MMVVLSAMTSFWRQLVDIVTKLTPNLAPKQDFGGLAFTTSSRTIQEQSRAIKEHQGYQGAC